MRIYRCFPASGSVDLVSLARQTTAEALTKEGPPHRVVIEANSTSELRRALADLQTILDMLPDDDPPGPADTTKDAGAA